MKIFFIINKKLNKKYINKYEIFKNKLYTKIYKYKILSKNLYLN